MGCSVVQVQLDRWITPVSPPKGVFTLGLLHRTTPKNLAYLVASNNQKLSRLVSEMDKPGYSWVSGLFRVVQIKVLLRRSSKKEPLERKAELFCRVTYLTEC